MRYGERNLQVEREGKGKREHGRQDYEGEFGMSLGRESKRHWGECWLRKRRNTRPGGQIDRSE